MKLPGCPGNWRVRKLSLVRDGLGLCPKEACMFCNKTRASCTEPFALRGRSSFIHSALFTPWDEEGPVGPAFPCLSDGPCPVTGSGSQNGVGDTFQGAEVRKPEDGVGGGL